MVSKYRTRSKKFTRKRKRSSRRSGPSARTGYLLAKQKLSLPFVIPAGVAFHAERIQFSIDVLPNFLAFARLFDQYRIKSASILMYPLTYTDPASNAGMTCVSSIDLDGGSLPTTMTDALQPSNARVSNWSSNGGNKPRCYISLRPRYMNVIEQDPTQPALADSYTLGPKDAWIDLQDTGRTVHNGVTMCWSMPTPLNNAIKCEYITTLNVEFRKIR
jgi:hypothetical protein